MYDRSSFIRGRLLAAGACGVAALFAVAIFAAATAEMIILPIENAEFVPANASRPEGAQFAVLRGDPATGPSSTLLRLRNTTGQLHVHSSDYDLVVVKGTMKHWQAGQSEAQAQALGPGSYWFQPGGAAHGDMCLSDECLVYVQWAGKRDGRLAQDAAPQPR